MSQLLQISFWLRKGRTARNGLTPIVVRLYYNAERVNIQPRLFVKASSWDEKKQRVRNKDTEAKVINGALDIIKHKLWSLYQQQLAAGKISLYDLKESFLSNGKPTYKLRQLINKHNEDFQQRLNVDRSQSTFEKYQFTLLKVDRFIAKRYKTPDIPLEKIDKKWIDDFYIFLRKEENNQHNTAAKYVKNLKHILAYGVELRWLESNPSQGYVCSYKETNQVILGPEELLRIENKRFAIPRLELVRKLFLLQCYTGLAYSDLAKLKKSNLEQGPDGSLWLNIRRTKTDTLVRYPLLRQAALIINELKQTSTFIESDLLIPITISSQRMNSYLKEIADLCEISKKLTTHVGRRTMASTVLLANGIPIEIISKILGHLKIATTQVYARVADEMVAKEIRLLDKRLK